MGSHVCVQHVRSHFFQSKRGFGKSTSNFSRFRIGSILADDDVYLRSYDSAVCFARPGAAFVETKTASLKSN